jgi:hypothetical protein
MREQVNAHAGAGRAGHTRRLDKRTSWLCMKGIGIGTKANLCGDFGGP